MIYGNKIITLCTAKVSDIQVSRFVSALNDKLVNNSASLMVYSINTELYWDDDNISAEVAVYDIIKYGITDAVIIMDEKIKNRSVVEKIIAESKANNIPVFVIDGKYEGVPCICFDYEKGFEKIVRHVFEHHTVKKPHFIAGMEGNDFSEKRIDIFKKVLAEQGIAFDESMLSYGDFWEQPAANATKALIDSGNIPDAVICANDTMAMAVCNVFQENGIRVPEDVIVSGFDGLDEIYFTSPKVSSACCDSSVIASAMYDVLEECFAHKKIDDIIYVVPKLIPNCSCGCEEYIDPQVHTDEVTDNFYHYQEDLRVLFEVASKMQTSDSFGQAAAHLHNYLLSEMFCLVNKSCMSKEVDYFSDDSGNGIDTEMYIIYNSDNTNEYNFRIYEHSKSKVSSYFSRLIEKKCPLIFNSIVFMGKVLGYCCFHFEKGNIANLSRIFPVVTAIGAGLGGYITKQHKKYLTDKIEEMDQKDPLTNLYNRKGFQAAFEKLAAQSYGRSIVIIASDLDRLKYINDNFGHDTGDKAVQTAAEIFKDSCPFGTLCVKYGGDEILAVLFGEYSAEDIIDRINDGLSKYNLKSGNEYKVSLSCGHYKTTFTRNFDFAEAVKKAEEKMFEVKKFRRLKAGILK